MNPITLRPRSDAPPWQRRASPLARTACIAYAALVLYASLAPWSGWRDLGVSPLAYLSAPWPRYVTHFDLLVNVLGYVPLGALIVFAVHPRLRGVAAVIVAASSGALLSASIEALQTFLPQRIASHVDLMTNSAGALLGAVVAAPFTSALIDRGRLAQWRYRWFARDAALPLVLLALWPLAQAHPMPMLFGLGAADGALLEWAQTHVTPALPPRGAWEPTEFVLAEAIVTTAGLLAAGLAIAALVPIRAARLASAIALIGAALLAKTLTYGVRFGPDHATSWWTAGAAAGLAIGLLSLSVAVVGTPRALGRAALLAVLVLLAAVALVPDNPYFAAWASQWRSGRLVHFNAAAEWMATAWPYAMAAWLAYAAIRRG